MIVDQETMGAWRTGHATSTSHVLLVGEDNPVSSDPRFALFCLPEGCSGHRLQKILCVSASDYLAQWRTNLCAGSWSTVEARERANVLSGGVLRASGNVTHALDMPWCLIVMLGRKVATAFQYQDDFFTSHELPNLVQLVSLPHPSGRNLVWNKPEMREQARSLYCAARAVTRPRCPGQAKEAR